VPERRYERFDIHPAVTDPRPTLIEVSAGAEVAVKRVDALPLGSDAVIVDVVVVATTAVCTGNVTRSAPAGMNTVAGALTADVLELVRETERPPAGAASVRATVPKRSGSPNTLSIGSPVLGTASETDTTVGPGVSMTCAWFVMPAFVAEIVTHVDEETRVYVTGNVRTRRPVGTVTDAGTAKLAQSLVRVKIAPLAGATATSEMSAVAVPSPDAIAGRTSKVKP
jgi:hypothetical protein